MVVRQVVIAALPFVVLVALIILAIRLRPRIQRWLYPDTGLEEWRAVAAGLSWSDRWNVRRAVDAGRATELRLARYAIQRAEALVAVNRKHLRSSFVRWTFFAYCVVVALALALMVVQATTERRTPLDWAVLGFFAAVFVGLVAIALFWTPVHLRQERRFRRTIALNHELLGDQSKSAVDNRD